MVIKVGLIGCGIMGSDHAAILHGMVAGAELAAVQDFDHARAAALAARLQDPRVHESADALISDPGIDAVIVASADGSHAGYVLACIAAGKPVLCEKPLAASSAACHEIVAAEVAAGRQFVQVGFMRRFDPGYVAMRQALVTGSVGRAVFLHCIHRNKVAPDYITSDLVIANSGVHEMDIARFVLGEDFAAVTVISARASAMSSGRQPQFVILETISGVVVTVEISPDARYGYDVQGELVCERASLSLAPVPPVSLRIDGHSGYPVEADWRTRFADAYRLQAAAWIASIAGGRPTGSSAWDGYAASLTAEAALAALASRQRTPIRLDAPPTLYAR
nr:Gfo/Idh/MocA family oxidoreductase [uncultured Lichenicoccus sp.]